MLGLGPKLPDIDPHPEVRPAFVLAVLSFVLFGLCTAGIVTNTFSLDNRAEAWVGTGLVGLGWLVFSGWALLLYSGAEVPDWSRRAGGDLLLAGIGVFTLIAGLPTFAAGVI